MRYSGYTLHATAAGLTATTSGTFNITPATADHLTITQQPTNAAADAVITPAITVEVRDASNNLVTSAANALTVAILANPGSGTLTGTLTQGAVSGIATFSDLNIDKVGTGYTLRFTATGLTGVTSVAFNITFGSARSPPGSRHTRRPPTRAGRAGAHRPRPGRRP